MQIKQFQVQSESESTARGQAVLEISAEIEIQSTMLFDLDFQLRIQHKGSGEEVYSRHIRQSGMDIAWLPKGHYLLSFKAADLTLAPGEYLIDLLAWRECNNLAILTDEKSIQQQLSKHLSSHSQPQWSIQSAKQGQDINLLSWSRQHDDWFFRHFDHAARVVIHMMLDNSSKLKGKILDVGCGDGIIDLGIFLRCQPELFVGIDPFKGYERLPEIVKSNHLPESVLAHPNLQFKPADGNAIPYPDEHFDVVLSWGSLEHIAGGYEGALREIYRVLKPGGLLFVHPGLFYGQLGNHLGEFFDDPYIHLKLTQEELKQRVLNTDPVLMDRAGDIANAEQYWQWYTELNPITVDGFEKIIRGMGFEPYRLAIRSAELVKYTPQLQPYSFSDLASSELYLSVKKPNRPER